MIIAFYFIMKGTIDPGKLDKMIDLFKYAIVSVAIATVTLIVSDLFKEREQDVKELEYFGKYADDIKKVDGIQERFELSKYLSIVAPGGMLKNSWKDYHDTLKIEYEEYLTLKKERQQLDTVSNPTEEQIIQKEQINQKIEQKETPLVALKTSLSPRVYIQIAEEGQRQIAGTLQSMLRNDNFVVPDIENVGRKTNIRIPATTEVRYYRDEELPEALRLISILKNLSSDLRVNETPRKIPGTGRGTRPGHYEIWFSKS